MGFLIFAIITNDKHSKPLLGLPLYITYLSLLVKPSLKYIFFLPTWHASVSMSKRPRNTMRGALRGRATRSTPPSQPKTLVRRAHRSPRHRRKPKPPRPRTIPSNPAPRRAAPRPVPAGICLCYPRAAAGPTTPPRPYPRRHASTLAWAPAPAAACSSGRPASPRPLS
jgi:hypothetical protein